MKIRTRVILLIAASVLQQGACAAESTPQAPMGRLFHTPATRAALERQRQAPPLTQAQDQGDRLRVDGVVMTSSGKSTLWLNQQAQTGRGRIAGITVTPSRQHPDRVRLSAGAQAPVDIKVGATVDLSTNASDDGLARGRIRIHK